MGDNFLVVFDFCIHKNTGKFLAHVGNQVECEAHANPIRFSKTL